MSRFLWFSKKTESRDFNPPSQDCEFILEETNEEKNLVVYITCDLKWNTQCSTAATTANRILGQIRASLSFLDKATLRLLYPGQIRPYLEYAVSSWNPYSRSKIYLREKVQRRATKMVKSLRNKPYDERLNDLELMSLEERRIRGDLIQVFKNYQRS
ncbi:unnamed protein product [Brachionus calyciflorus]|uniref:Uncharacterized protein n=1 Tax=Brachionus calyciflorus TaxID=104777 RepID=A0A814D7S9_9BILA|nr:unnamed protein product [Brachionus calyciflorus]